MDNSGIALLVAIFSPTIGVMCMIMAKPYIKNKTKKKLPLHICNIVCVLGLIIYISFLVCTTSGKHINPNVEYIEYPIQKLTTSQVYFDDNDGYSLDESYVIVEDLNKEYINVVIIEEEKYTLQWLFKINTSSRKYHVYLSEENYDRLQNGNVIYKQ